MVSVTLPNTGFWAFNSLSADTPGFFRVTATCLVLDVDRSTKMVSKLKLMSVPYRIFKNTAFTMFSGALEVAKSEWANDWAETRCCIELRLKIKAVSFISLSHLSHQKKLIIFLMGLVFSKRHMTTPK